MRARFESNPEDMHAAIGPCIHSCCYAVGDEVIEEFQSQFAYADELFSEVYDRDPIKDKYPLLFLTARAPGHSNIGPQTHLDLVKANRRQLLNAGLRSENIWAAEECTSCRTDLLFSHRAESGYTGRMMAAIGMRPPQDPKRRKHR
jgi:copper oxidase (laccase) domain-containing protein